MCDLIYADGASRAISSTVSVLIALWPYNGVCCQVNTVQCTAPQSEHGLSAQLNYSSITLHAECQYECKQQAAANGQRHHHRHHNGRASHKAR